MRRRVHMLARFNLAVGYAQCTYVDHRLPHPADAKAVPVWLSLSLSLFPGEPCQFPYRLRRPVNALGSLF